MESDKQVFCWNVTFLFILIKENIWVWLSDVWPAAQLVSASLIHLLFLTITSCTSRPRRPSPRKLDLCVLQRGLLGVFLSLPPLRVIKCAAAAAQRTDDSFFPVEKRSAFSAQTGQIPQGARREGERDVGGGDARPSTKVLTPFTVSSDECRLWPRIHADLQCVFKLYAFHFNRGQWLEISQCWTHFWQNKTGSEGNNAECEKRKQTNLCLKWF